MKPSSLLKQMAQFHYWGLSLLGAEFVRGPSLSGAKMSRNLGGLSLAGPTEAQLVFFL